MDAWNPKTLSVPELSRRSGVSINALNKLKYGKSASTSAENAQRLAAALGFDWSADAPPGLSEPPPAETYIARALAQLDKEPEEGADEKPFEIQFSQVDGVVKVAAVIRDPQGFAKLRATLDALEMLNR